MPDPQQSSFVWYHAKRTDEPQVKAWLDVVRQTFSVDARLYIREHDNTVTFMEVFTNISNQTNVDIEYLSTQYDVFNNLSRRSETFEEIRG